MIIQFYVARTQYPTPVRANANQPVRVVKRDPGIPEVIDNSDDGADEYYGDRGWPFEQEQVRVNRAE
jgi:hypothetical protein